MAVGGRRGGSSSPRRESTGACQVALDRRTVGSGKAPTSSPASRTDTPVLGRAQHGHSLVLAFESLPVAGLDTDRGVQGEACPELVEGPQPWPQADQPRAKPMATFTIRYLIVFWRVRTVLHRPAPVRSTVRNTSRLSPHSMKANGSPLAFFLVVFCGLAGFMGACADFADGPT
jgi:hypothetical protein